MGVKQAGFLTVAAQWNKDQTVHSALNSYVRKGNPRSNKSIYVVHRLDQATSGLLVFAKSEHAQQFLKNNWSQFTKKYLTVVHGHLAKKSDLVESFLEEDEDYHVHTFSEAGENRKLARTQYAVLKENQKMSLVEVNLLTGKKNQIRVHMASLGHPVVGDSKYGPQFPKNHELLLHSYQLELIHPHSQKRILFEAEPPAYFKKVFTI